MIAAVAVLAVDRCALIAGLRSTSARYGCVTLRCSRRSAPRSILAGLALQAVVVALLAAVAGGILSPLLAPLFPMTVVVPSECLRGATGDRAIVIGSRASVAGLRRGGDRSTSVRGP